MRTDDEVPRAPSAATTVLVAGVVLPIAVFAVLALSASLSSPGVADRTIFAHLHAATEWSPEPMPGADDRLLRLLMPVVLRIDDHEIALLAVLALGCLLVARRLRGAVFAVLALAIVLATPLLKSFFDRGAPLPVPGEVAFPSGHGLGSMAIAAALVVLAWGTRWRWPVLVVAVLFVTAIGLAVVGNGGHWPSDVLAGWCLAIAWVSMLWVGVRRRVAGDVGAYLRAPGLRPHPETPGPGTV